MQRPDVDGLLDELTWEQLAEWEAYFRWIGGERWRQAGVVASAVHNLTVAIGKAFGGKGEYASPEEMIPLVRSDAEGNGDDSGIDALERGLTNWAEGVLGKKP